jgi:DNA-binding MarR family transcriptional regulator
MKLKSTIDTISEAVKLNLTSPILCVLLYFNEYEKSPIVEVADRLCTCNNNLGVTLKKMYDNGIIEIHPEKVIGANGHMLKQYTLTNLGKRTSATIIKHKPKSVMRILDYIINATSNGIILLDLRILLYVAETNMRTASDVTERLEASCPVIKRRMNKMAVDGKLDRIIKGRVTQFTLSAYGERITLDILGIKIKQKI